MVYEVKRCYRKLQADNEMQNLIASVKHVASNFTFDHLLYSIKWLGGVEKHVTLRQHGNAKSAHASSYIRADPLLREKVSS